jgi:hypothetical protein
MDAVRSDASEGQSQETSGALEFDPFLVPLLPHSDIIDESMHTDPDPLSRGTVQRST